MLRVILISLSLLASTACSTLNGGGASESREGNRPGASQLSYSETPIVHQTTGKTLMQKIDRDRWVQLRRGSKNEYVKLYATLGASEWDVAIADARGILQKNPKDEAALTVLAIGLAMKKNYSLAAYYAKLLNDYHPGNPEVNNILGLAEMNRPGATYEDYRSAIRQFEKAFNSSESQVASGMNLAQLHLEMGNLEAARDVFHAVKGRCGDCNEALLGYGIALARLQSFEKAEEAFEDVLDRDAHNAYALFYLALVAKYGRNDNDAAMQKLSTLLQDPEVKNLEIQRKANFLLRRIQAQVYGKPKDIVSGKPQKGKKKAPAPLSDVTAEDLEKVINAE